MMLLPRYFYVRINYRINYAMAYIDYRMTPSNAMNCRQRPPVKIFRQVPLMSAQHD